MRRSRQNGNSDVRRWPWRKGERSDPDATAISWWALAPLALGTFTVALEGVILTGMLPSVSHDIHARTSTVGQALALYPLTYVILSPVLAVFFGGKSRKRVSAIGLMVFAAGNLLNAAAMSVLVLIVGRLVSAIGASMFLPNAAARAAAIGAERRGRALSLVASGPSAATIVGAPVGIVIGSVVGWRVVLASLAFLSLTAASLQRVGGLGDARVAGLGMRDRLRFLRDPRMLRIVLLTLVIVCGEFIVYAYISLIVLADHGSVAPALMVFGIGTASGTIVGGLLVDKFGWRAALLVSMSGMLVAISAISIIRSPFILLAALLAWGLSGWIFTPSQTNRLFAAFPENGALLVVLNASAVYLGVSLGGLLGGAISAHLGVRYLPLAASALVGAGLATGCASVRQPAVGHHPEPRAPAARGRAG
jgi:predicted MFS family arabinose efflux permease